MSGDIVIIDDSELVLRVLSEALQGRGWSVRPANGGAEGVALIEQRRPDVVISDLHMPEMSGHEVIEAVHAIDRQLPVILLSSDADLAAVLGAIRRGAFDYVLKSDLGNLGQAVERAHAYSTMTRKAAAPEAPDHGFALLALEAAVGDLEAALLEGDKAETTDALDRIKATIHHMTGGS